VSDSLKAFNAPGAGESLPFEAIRHEAADLAERLDGSRTSRWLGTLITTVKQYPPSVRRLGEINTLYHSAFSDFRGKPQRPEAGLSNAVQSKVDPFVKTGGRAVLRATFLLFLSLRCLF
jgi:hypothetical protein